MSDIFQEVEEEVRRERLAKLWDKYGILVIAAGLAIVLGVAGWRGWEWWQERQAQAAGARFEAALRLSADGKHADADAALAMLQADAPAGYVLLARFARAAESAATDKAAGVTAYDALAVDAKVPSVFRDLAQVRAALILVDTASYADLRLRLEPLAAPESSFRHTARELLALSAWRGGDRDAAKRWVELILGDTSATANLRVRAEILRDLLASAGPAAAPPAAPRATTN